MKVNKKGGKETLEKNDLKGKWIEGKELYKKNILNKNIMHWLEIKTE